MCECDGSECRGDDNSVCNRLDSQAVNTCGSCVCDQMVGETCQCSKGGGGGGALEECQAPSDDRECSGQGNCQCGQCQCNKGWVGEYCECSKGSLDCGQQERRDLGLPADRGQHVCNNGTTECQCRADWSGPALQPACACSSHTDRCRVGGSSEEDCSGRGKCQCNKCQCEQGFSGSFCQLDLSKDLEQDTCDRMAPCVLHQIYGTNQSVPADKREVMRVRSVLLSRCHIPGMEGGLHGGRQAGLLHQLHHRPDQQQRGGHHDGRGQQQWRPRSALRTERD